jgi:hypothetical protein
MITDDPVYMAHVWRLAYAVDHMHDDRPFLQQMIADTSPGGRPFIIKLVADAAARCAVRTHGSAR